MGANQSSMGASSASSSSSSSSSTFSSTSREHDHWLTASAARVLDDAYVGEWHRKNDWFVWSEKERRRAAQQPNSNSAGSSGRERSEFFEDVYSYLGPHFSGLQTQRLASIVFEVAAQCEAAQGKSMAAKQQAFIRRIHLAIEAHRAAQNKARAQSQSLALAPALSSPANKLVTLNRPLSPRQQQDELKKLPLSQQLSIRWLLSVLQSLQSESAADPVAQSACNALLLQQLLPLLDELTPIFTSGMDVSKLGVMEAVEAFLVRAFKQGQLALTAPSADAAVPFPLAQVTSSLLALALSRSKLSALLQVLHPLLLSHARAATQPELRVFDDMIMKPQLLLKRINATQGPRAGAYLRGASQRRASLSGVARSTGALLGWGTGQTCGKLGLGSQATVKAPTALPEFESEKVVSVSAFQNHVLVADSDGRVYGFGSNETHRLGFEDVSNRTRPSPIPFFADKGKVVQVAVGNEFSALLTAEGHVWCFGDGQNFKLGQSSSVLSKVPLMVTALQQQKVTAITCGGFHTMAITASHELYSWGKGNRGQLGNGSLVDSAPTPVATFSGLPLRQIAAGWEHSLVLSADGHVWSFGGGYDNKAVTGHGADSAAAEGQKTPKLIAAFAGMEVVHVAAGWDHSLFVTADGAAWACGDGSGGRLGAGDVSDQALPKRIRGFVASATDSTEAKIVACAGGESHSAFVTIDGSIFVAGTDGTNAAAIKTVPTRVEAQPKPCKFVTCGGKVTFALTGLPALGGAAPTAATADKAESSADAEESGLSFFDTASIVAHPSLATPLHPDTTRSAKLTAVMLLAQLDRLAAQQAYERDAARGVGPSVEALQAPYCIEATSDTLAKLFEIVNVYTQQVGRQLTEAEQRRAAGLPPLVIAQPPVAPIVGPTAAERAAAARAAAVAAAEADAAASTEVHRHVTCDHCRVGPVVGARWKCNTCHDFDYCNACRLLNPEVASHKKSHSFTRMGVSGVYADARPVEIAVVPDPDPAEVTCEWHDSYVLLAALRLLKANFTRLLMSQVPLASMGIDAAGGEVDASAAAAQSAQAAAAQEQIRFSIQELQSYLLRMVDGDFGFPLAGAPSSSASSASAVGPSQPAADGAIESGASATLSPADHARELASALRSEAVQFLRVGLEVFYGGQAAKEELVESLLASDSTPRSQLLAPALLGRLAEDSMVTAFVPDVLQQAQVHKKDVSKGSNKSLSVVAESSAASAVEDDSPVLVDSAQESDSDGQSHEHAAAAAAQAMEDSVGDNGNDASSASLELVEAQAQALLQKLVNASALADSAIQSAQAAVDGAQQHQQEQEQDGGSDQGSDDDQGDDQGGDGDEMDGSHVAAPEGEAEVLPSFNCLICTFANEAGVHECQMCGSERPPVNDLAANNDAAFQEQLAQMQAAIQREQAQLLEEQMAAMENQQMLLAQQLSNAASGGSDAQGGAGANDGADAASPAGPAAPASSPQPAHPPASLYSLISNLSSPVAPQSQSSSSPVNVSVSLAAGSSPGLGMLASPSQGHALMFDDESKNGDDDAKVANLQLSPIATPVQSPLQSSNGDGNSAAGSSHSHSLSLSMALSPMPMPVPPPSVSAPTPSDKAAAEAAAKATADAEAAAAAATLAQEVQFKARSKQLCSLLNRLVTSTALDVRAQLTTAAALPSSALESLPAPSSDIDPRLQFLISLQKHTLSWSASCAEQFAREKSKAAEDKAVGDDKAAALWVDACARSHTISLNAVRQYAELVLDASLELTEQANSVIRERGSSSVTQTSDAAAFAFPLHVGSILQRSLVGVALPSLLLSIGLFPTSASTLSSSLSSKYVALLSSLHLLSSSTQSLHATLTAMLPSREQEKQARRDEREAQKNKLRKEKQKAREAKLKKKDGTADSAASAASAADEEKKTEEKKDENANTSVADDASPHSKEQAQSWHEQCSAQLGFISELQRQGSWLMAGVIETELGDNVDIGDGGDEAAADGTGSSLSRHHSNTAPLSPLRAAAQSDLQLVNSSPLSQLQLSHSTPLEATPAEAEWLASDLLKLGLEDGSVGFDEADETDGGDSDEELAAPEPLELSRRLTPSSRSAHITVDDGVKFCTDMGAGLNVAARLWDWMSQTGRKEIIGRPEPWLDQTARCAFAALLKHHGLLAEAISYGRLIVRKDKQLSTQFAPAPELMAAWREAQGIRLHCLRTAQQITQKRELAREKQLQQQGEAQDDGAASTASVVPAAPSSTEQACRPVLTCAAFLLRISPSLENVHARPESGLQHAFAIRGLLSLRGGSSGSTRWSVLRTLFRVAHRFRFLKVQAVLESFEKTYLDRSCFKQTRSFLCSGADCGRMEKLMEMRSRKAIKRLHALRRLQSLLTLLSAPVCQIELLAGLRRSMSQRNILDGIDGCGSILIGLIRKQFTKLMTEVTRMVSPAADTHSAVRMAALGCWVFTVRRESSDHALIAQSGIIKAVQGLLSKTGQAQSSGGALSLTAASSSSSLAATVAASSSSTSLQDREDAKDQKKLMSIAWKVQKLLAVELGIGVKTALSGDVSADVQLDRHSPYLDTVLQVLYDELHRSLVAWSRGDTGSSASSSASFTSSALRDIPAFGALPTNSGMSELVPARAAVQLKPNVLGYSYSITNPNPQAAADSKDSKENVKVAAPAPPKSGLFGASPAQAAAPAAPSAPSNRSDFTLSMWICLARDSASSSSSSSSLHNVPQLIALRAAGSPGAHFLPAVLLNDSDTRIKVLVSTSGSSQPESAVSTAKLPVRKWCHLVVTLSDKNLSIWINGELDSTKTLSAAIRPATATADELHVGRCRSRVAPLFPLGIEGQVGGVCWWYRALPSSGVKELLTSGDHPRSHAHVTYATRLVSLLGSLDGMPCFLSRKWMQLFCWLLHNGTVTIRVRMLRLLRRLLPNMSPKRAQQLLMGAPPKSPAFSLSTPVSPQAGAAGGGGDSAFSVQSVELDGQENGERLLEYLFDLINAAALPKEEAQQLLAKWQSVITLPPLPEPQASATPAASPLSAKDDAATFSFASSILPGLLGTSAASTSTAAASVVEEPEAESTVAAETVMLLRHLLHIPTASSSDEDGSASFSTALPLSSPKLSPSLSPTALLPHNLPSFWPVLLMSVMGANLRAVPAALDAQRRQRQQKQLTADSGKSTETVTSSSPAPPVSSGIAGSAIFGSSSSASVAAEPSFDIIVPASLPSFVQEQSSSASVPFARALSTLEVIGGHVPTLRIGAAVVLRSLPSVPSALHNQTAHVLEYEPNRQSADVAVRTHASAAEGAGSSGSGSGSGSSLPPLPTSATFDVTWLQAVEELQMPTAQAVGLVAELLPMFRLVIGEYHKQIAATIGVNPFAASASAAESDGKEAEEKSGPSSSSSSSGASATSASSSAPAPAAAASSSQDLLLSHVGSRLVKVMSSLLSDPTLVAKLLAQGFLKDLVALSATPVILDAAPSSSAVAAEAPALEEHRLQLWTALRNLKATPADAADASKSAADGGSKKSDETKAASAATSVPDAPPAPVAPKSAVELDQESKIANLEGMGFERDFCRKALQRNGWNASNAADWLLSHTDALEKEKAAEAELERLQKLSHKMIAERAAVESKIQRGDASQLAAMLRGLAPTPDRDIPEYVPGGDTCEEQFAADYFPPDETSSALLDVNASVAGAPAAGSISLSNLLAGGSVAAAPSASGSIGFSSMLASSNFNVSSSEMSSAGGAPSLFSFPQSSLAPSSGGFGGSSWLAAAAQAADKPAAGSVSAMIAAVQARNQAPAAEPSSRPAAAVPASGNTAQALLAAIERVDTALSILYARESVLSILVHWPSSSGVSLTASALGDSALIQRFLKLATFRQSVTASIARRTVHSSGQMVVLKKLLAGDADLRAFVLEEALRHFAKAATPAYAPVCWSHRKLEESDVSALTAPRIEMAEWTLHALLQLCSECESASSGLGAASGLTLLPAQMVSAVVTAMPQRVVTGRYCGVLSQRSNKFDQRFLFTAARLSADETSQELEGVVTCVGVGSARFRGTAKEDGSVELQSYELISGGIVVPCTYTLKATVTEPSQLQKLDGTWKSGSTSGELHVQLENASVRAEPMDEAAPAPSSILSLDTFARLAHCANSPNLCLREKIFKLLHAQLHALVRQAQWHEAQQLAEDGKGAAYESRIGSLAVLGEYIAALPVDKLQSMLTQRLKVEEGRLLSSTYTVALLDLCATVQSLAAECKLAAQQPDPSESASDEDVQRYLEQQPALRLDETLVQSLEVSWSTAAPPPVTVADGGGDSDADVDRFHYVLEMSESAVLSSSSVAVSTDKFEAVYVGPGVVWCQEGLAEHASYRFRVAVLDTRTKKRGAYSAVLTAKTAAGLQWAAASAKDAGCALSADGLAATFVTSSSRWRTLLANRAWSSGTHSWFVRIDKCASSSLFVGVAKANCNKQLYIGSDTFSWAVYAKEGRRFHSNIRLPDAKPAGGGAAPLVAWKNEPFANGDVIKLTLDCDAGLLTMQRNGAELGVAFDFLPKNEPLLPAISFNTNGDVVTILQGNQAAQIAKDSKSKAPASSDSAKKDAATASSAAEANVKDWMTRSLSRLAWCSRFLRCVDQRAPFPSDVSQLVYSRTVQFAARTTRKLQLQDGSAVQVNLSPAACAAAGVTLGQRVNTKQGRGIVLGVEVVGIKARRELANAITRSCSIEIEQQVEQEAATVPTTPAKAGPAASVVDQSPACVHPAGLGDKAAGNYDATVTHPAAATPAAASSSAPDAAFCTPAKPSSSSSGSLADAASSPPAVQKAPAVPSLSLSSASSTRLTFHAPKELVLWVKIDGVDDPAPVRKGELLAPASEKTEQKESESKQSEEDGDEKESSSTAPAQAAAVTAAASSSASSSSSAVAAPVALPSPWHLSSFLAVLNSTKLHPQVDVQLAHLVNALADALDCQPTSLLLHDLRSAMPLSPQLYPALAPLSLQQLVVRFCLLTTFNVLIDPVLMDVERQVGLSPAGGMDAHSPSSPSVGSLLSAHRDLLFSRVKLRHFHSLVEKTATYTKPSDDPYELAPGIKTITLNRHRAAKAKELGAGESRMAHSMLAQARRELGHWQASELRRHYVKAEDGAGANGRSSRTFVVKLAGEGVRDLGGVYSEIMASFMEELQSTTDGAQAQPVLPFLLRTPNARSGVGLDQDGWMLNPSQSSHSSLEYYRFIGQLIGVAVRGNIQLSLNLHPLFWKTLVGQPLTLQDLDATDITFVHMITKMREQAATLRAQATAQTAGGSLTALTLGGGSVDADDLGSMFGAMFGVENFTVVLGDGVTTVELVPDGASRPLTLANCDEWIALAVEARLHESSLQLGALRSGLASILPLHLVCFMSWWELQRVVCGLSDFSVSLLQSVTRYEGGMSESTPHVQFFWRVLAEFTAQQRAQFMRFVFARDRLPARPHELGIHFKIQPPLANTAANPDAHFPSTHTCFFSLSLPAYTSAAALRSKLLYAMESCTSMDGDLVLKNSELYDYSADDVK